MAIDMTTVKEITHNNKDVIKIEDSNGNILWQKQGGQTVTITFNRRAYGMYATVSANINPPFGDGYGIYSNFRRITVSQLTDNTSAPPTTSNAEWIILDTTEAQNIVNKAYTSDTTIPIHYDDEFTSSNFYLCYIKNNELWFAGNTDLIDVQNPNLLYTTNDITKALTFRYIEKAYGSYRSYYDAVRTANLSTNKYIGLTTSKGLYLGYARPSSQTSPSDTESITYTI